MESKKLMTFACESCREGKRKCDAEKPQCSRCQRQGKLCVYVTEDKPKRRKYWDEEYVHSLENQVKTLLAALNDRTVQDASSSNASPSRIRAPTDYQTRSTPSTDYLPRERQIESNAEPPRTDTQLYDDRSVSAMEELSVMMWRTNIGDGVTIVNDPVGGPHLVDTAEQHKPTVHISPPASILAYCEDDDLIHELGDLFLDHINSEFQFTSATSTDVLLGCPFQPIGHTFLHSAMLAVGAVFSDRPEALKISDAFAEFAESLVFTCFRQEPSIQVLQGLCMLSWRSLALGRDQFGWIFISMAAGLCVHLRLHVLALDECSARSWHPQDAEIRTFWMFYLIDRTAISILGRNCVLPWRRVNVPDLDGTVNSLTASMAEISFSWQCKLWFLHDEQMDQIFASRFDSMPTQQQVLLLVSTHEALNSFFKSRDRRLDLRGLDTSRHVLFFHMAYQMALLITLPPFLKCLCARKTSGPSEDSEVMLLSLRSLTSAASNMIRLVRIYRDGHPEQWKQANPVVIHHLLSAAIVHMMNATSKTASLKTRSTMWLRVCMELLAQLEAHWPTRANKTINVIRVLAERWKVLGALPVQYSASLHPSGGTRPQSTADHVGQKTAPPQSLYVFAEAGMLESSLGTADHNLSDLYTDLVASNSGPWDAQYTFDNISFPEDSSWLIETGLLDVHAPG